MSYPETEPKDKLGYNETCTLSTFGKIWLLSPNLSDILSDSDLENAGLGTKRGCIQGPCAAITNSRQCVSI